MKIVIAGGTGFIGVWLVKMLLGGGGYEILCLVREKSDKSVLPKDPMVRIITVDFKNCEELVECMDGAEVLIDLVGQVGGFSIPYEDFYNTNFVVTKKILEACEKCAIKQFIYCSTPGVQGFGIRLSAETEPYHPRNAYEKTKVIAEQEIIDFCKNTNMKYTIIRPDFVYGPGDTRRVKLYRNIKNRKFILTTSGKSYLHPTYVEDVGQGIIKSINNIASYNEVFNISAEDDITAKEYLQIIAKCTDSKLIQINIGYRFSIISATIIKVLCEKLLRKEAFVSKDKIDFLALNHSTSNTKAKELLGFQAEYTFEHGMKKTIQWCKEKELLGDVSNEKE